ncbi:class F sortase [Nocardioides euryhalodurans]|uniref:class F sortase n=1 Tax=Nocardioides euryhalodurans TaxID=2518370 RepID=UPI001FC993BE|nr:class F sortase [Nocardioides euryhalodurans]
MTDVDTATGRGRPRWWAVVAGVVLLAAGLVWWLAPGSGTVEDAVDPTAPAEESTSVVPGEELSEDDLPQAAPAPARAGSPTEVRIPALDVASPVVPIGAPGGVLTPPADPQTLGWWADGSRPGDPQGSALVTGHTVSTGGGALDDLEQLTAGDDVVVRAGNRSLTYAVRSTEVLGKGDLARRAEELFDQGVPGRLVLITCEDWNGSEYLSNVVVTAMPTGVRR